MSNRVRQSGRELLRPLEEAPLMEYRAFAARFFKFAKPDFRPPKLLSRNPRYLYWKTSSRIVLLYLKKDLMRLPVLLKVMHLVFTVFKVSRLRLLYSDRVLIIFCKLILSRDKRTRSSAQIKQESFVWSSIIGG